METIYFEVETLGGTKLSVCEAARFSSDFLEENQISDSGVFLVTEKQLGSDLYGGELIAVMPTFLAAARMCELLAKL